MRNLRKFIGTILTCLVFCLFYANAWASHIFGGTVTYECDGTGRYIFKLTVYRDCNGADVSSTSQTLKVWNHPTLNQIILNYTDRTTISPTGTQVPGGPACFDCDITNNGNIGVGSIQKVTYTSAPIQISGIPPQSGWVFTYDDFSRNGNISNLNNPLNYGVTIRAKIFAVNTANNTCNDNSVQFLQSPHFVTCTGKPYKMNLNPVDPDLDSIRIDWDQPLNYLANSPYIEGQHPAAIPYVGNYSFTSPTPNSTTNALNQDTQLNFNNGEITFLSNISGNFVIKIKASSYRNGQLISVVEHEMQIIVVNCTANNNAPVVNGPFGGQWETTVDAGDLVQFTLQSTDVELLQDGTPQSNSILATGLLLGPNPVQATGCIIEPCATLNNGLPIVGVQGASLQFNWQTDCDHLRDYQNNEMDVVPYQFVFRVQDDFCPIPQVVFHTVTVNLRNPFIVPPSQLTCIQGGLNNEFTVNWSTANTNLDYFIAYELYTVEQGLMQTFTDVNSSSFTTTLTDDLQWYLMTVSGCDGDARRSSDTLRNIFLNLSNVNLGIGAMDWNRPSMPAQVGMGSIYTVYKEYPVGTWTNISTTNYNLPQYQDIIAVCSEFLSYYVEIQDGNCVHRSQIVGDNFSDQTPPNIASMTNVSIDTLSGNTSISWNPSTSPDTYGYIVYVTDPATNWLVELDTIWGATNTTYNYLEGFDQGSLTYTIAAFDSCPSPLGAPFNLSARDPNLQGTIFLQLQPSICGGSILLDWSAYRGWDVDHYDVLFSLNGAPYQQINVGTEVDYVYQAGVGDDLQFFVRAVHLDGRESYSHKRTVELEPAIIPSFHFIQYATVQQGDKNIKISYTLDPNVPVSKYVLEKKVDGVFVTIAETTATPLVWEFIDEDVNVDEQLYSYRVFYYDTCNLRSLASNVATTMLLQGQIDQTELLTYLTWTPYTVFNGSTVYYNLFRRVDEPYDGVAVAENDILKLSHEDNVYDIETNGLVCYMVEAVEGTNIIGERNKSYSNEICLEVEPLLFVPNAFLPTGEINTIWKPVLRNVDVNSYQMAIFDRWGQTIFQTNDVNEGWDGTVNRSTKIAPTGMFNYIISFDLGKGEQFVKRGHVNLIR